MKILHEDAAVLAVEKPAGVSMATSTRPGHGEKEVLARLAGEARAAELFLVHRLDVGTSGVVLLARTKEAHAALSRAFQERRAKKTYRALVYGHPVPARGTYDDALARDPKDGRRMKAAAIGKPSLTEYETLRRYRGLADLRLSPATGRTHQIRVHLSAHGHPIAGDDLYGGATRFRGIREPAVARALAALARPLLHAERVVVAELGLDVAAPLPDEYERLLVLLSRT